jgi:hypothetical protein
MSTPLQVKILRDGKEFGTFEAKDIIHLTGGDNYLVYHLKPHTDLYMHEGMTEWAPLIELVRKLSAPLNYRIAQAGKEVGTDALGEVFLLPRGITGNFTEVGTYDLDEVFRLLAVGTLKPTDLYKTEGMTSWNLLSNLEIQRRYGLDLK